MNKVIILFIVTIFVNPTFSQSYGEVGLFVGGTTFRGDVHSTVSDNTHLSVGIKYRNNFNSRWSWSFDVRHAKLSGDDQFSDSQFEAQRNLSFQSNVLEFGTSVEFNFLEFKPHSPQSFFQVADVFSPYVSVGISLIRFNPKAYLSGNLYELHPLETEGVKYSRIAVTLPIGLGFKFRVSDRMILGLSGELRITSSDYLDDVSTRYPTDPDVMSKTAQDMSNRTLQSQGPDGDSWGAQRGDDYNNDWFSYLGITISYNLKKNPGTCHFNPSK
ncbi:MAG: hypothetical protein ACI85Q_000436 [Salibacteraceae bacterium]|jgi:hypothetical protein